jgi:hypothetical protein
MFRLFKDDDQYDAWKALVANAISDVLVVGFLSAMLCLW